MRWVGERPKSMPPRALSTQSGVGLIELLTVMVLGSVLLAVAMPAFWSYYQEQRLHTATSQTRNLVRYARMKALKEKVPHRILFHDENAVTPNTIEVQNNEGGPFVTLPQHVYPLPAGVKILGSGPTDSMDSVTAGRRGECNSGKVFIQGHNGTLEVTSIEPTCHTKVL